MGQVGVNSVNSMQSISVGKLRVMILSEQPRSTLTRIRLLIPLRIWADAAGATLLVKSFDSFRLVDVTSADVFIIQRGCNSYAALIAECIKGKGKPFVYEIDDLLMDIPPFLGHHVGMIQNRQIIIDLIGQADLVTCTQPILARQLVRFNENVRICPNYGYIQGGPANNFAVSVKGEVATLVVAATDKVLVEFVLEAIRLIIEKHQSRIRLVVIGPIGEVFRAAGIDADYYPILAHEDFGVFVSGLFNPVGIIPLDDSIFSSCKSAVKYFDYSVAGVATVCSNVSPYRDVVCDGVDGFLVENVTSAWYGALDRLVSDPCLRLAVSELAQAKVLAEHTVSTVVNAWNDVFRSLDVYGSERGSVGLPLLVYSWKRVKFSLMRLNRLRVNRRRRAKLIASN